MIRTRRKEKGLKAKDLATELECSVSSIHAIERGNQSGRLKCLYMAKLGFSVGDITRLTTGVNNHDIEDI